MKILVYSPYLDILGGGEQYLLQFADCLQSRHSVTFVCQEKTTLKKAAKRFQVDSESIKIIPFLPPRVKLRQFDVLFFVSDGSIPFLPFSKSILLFMSPFTNVAGRSLFNQLKLKFIDHVVCFSRYTKKFIDQEFAVDSQLIYPAVSLPRLNLAKKKLILSVGRFTTSLHVKRQDCLIDSFIDLEPKLPDWKLVLAGGTESGSAALINRLRKKSTGHKISIRTNVSSRVLHQLYAQAKVYWHATGFGADLKLNPQKAEHFGISVVEAMTQGAVPVVFNAGGPTEIVNSQSGRTWDNLAELKEITLKLARNNSLLLKLQSGAEKRSRFFSKTNFCQKFYDLVES